MAEGERKIRVNAAQCLDCGQRVESKHRHDFQQCGCPNGLYVDGGHDYTRGGARDLRRVMLLVEYEKED